MSVGVTDAKKNVSLRSKNSLIEIDTQKAYYRILGWRQAL